MTTGFGSKLRHNIHSEDIIAFIGVYDVFSASIAARYYKGLFISGYSFSASFYGLPDIGFIAWSDMVSFAQRIKTILPEHHIIVDIDDGYVDVHTACHVVSLLENIGVTGVVLEDQHRPRRCGHMGGKQILGLEQYLEKLHRVLEVRRDLFVIARTDAIEEDEILRRAQAFAEIGADAILVDGINELGILSKIEACTKKPIMFNQIIGGKSPVCSLQELIKAKVSLVNYSTPCLFAAQEAMEKTMQELIENNGRLASSSKVDLAGCNRIMEENLLRRDSMVVK